jgi:hypothetical protein
MRENEAIAEQIANCLSSDPDVIAEGIERITRALDKKDEAKTVLVDYLIWNLNQTIKNLAAAKREVNMPMIAEFLDHIAPQLPLEDA